MEDLKQSAQRDLIAAVRRWLRYAEGSELVLPLQLAELLQDEIQRRARYVAQRVVGGE